MEFIRISNSNKYADSRVGFQEKEFHAIFRHNFFFLIFPFVSKFVGEKIGLFELTLPLTSRE